MQKVGGMLWTWIAMVLAFAIYLLAISVAFTNVPVDWFDAMLVAVVLVPSLLLWLWSGASYWAIGTWLIPAAVLIGAAWLTVPESIAFTVIAGTVGVAVWSFACTEAGNQVWSRWNETVARPFWRSGLSLGDRDAYDALDRINTAAGESAERLTDPAAGAEEARATSRKLRALQVLDPGWSAVASAMAEDWEAYAHHLAQADSAPSEQSHADKGSVALTELLRERSRPFRLMQVSLRSPA